jgi:hypothetical protein
MKNVILNNVIKNEDIYFSEPVKNTVIMNSTFRRIIYSNNFISLNNISILMNMENVKIVKFYQKHKCNFNVENSSNIINITNITNIEKNILSKIKLNSKIPKFSILEQVRNGFIKFSTNTNDKIDFSNNNINIFLKISGIWENESEYGLTYKFYID